MKHKLCSINDIQSNATKEFEIDTGSSIIKLFVVHKNQQFFAYNNSCPHTGSPLNWQPDQFLDLEDNYIQCATHDALFEIDTGLCRYGPCTGDSLEELELSIESDTIFLHLK